MDFEGYEREGYSAYATLAATVGTILTAAIGAHEGYRLQQVKERAKQSASLRNKLEQRGIFATETLETEIKDLAGCRVIFYTNSDVTRFINSGILHENFEVLETKLHHPGREVDDAADLYISNHFLVSLSSARIALPEYARFAGMRCEIQIQTILNHAWAEMAHDTIYKVPALGDFGGKAFAGIKSRMQKVSRKYLLPAGYEFQKIASDFQRLIAGKALFDGAVLEAIVEAEDNNSRADALETFSQNVLPFYDDLQTVFPEVVTRLVAAADRARKMAPLSIETPYGALPAKTYADITKAISAILRDYRYLDVDVTFKALRHLYGSARSAEERKPLFELGKALSKHHVDVWRQYGPAVQTMLVIHIESLDEDKCRTLAPLLGVILHEVLGSEVSGTTNSSTSVTFHSGAVVASDALRNLRKKAIGLMRRLFSLSESDEQRDAVLVALQTAIHAPYRGLYSNALAHQIMDDTCEVIEFLTEIAPVLSLGALRTAEGWVHRRYWMYADLPASMQGDRDLFESRVRVEHAALQFRDIVNANLEFVTFKTLVGFDSVFPPAWEDRNFRYTEANAYRTEQVAALVESVENANADVWFDRVSRFAQTTSDDAATFPVFGDFLKLLAQAQPAIVFGFIDKFDAPLSDFLPRMITGLMLSTEHVRALAQINAWLDAGKFIREIAWHLQFADSFDEALLVRTFQSALQYHDLNAVRTVMVAAARQFPDHPGTLINSVFLPTIRTLHAAGDYSWVRMQWFSWLDNPMLRTLNQEQADLVLAALVTCPELEYDAEFIAAAIAERWPASVVALIGSRQAFALTDAAPSNYDAVPFEVHQLRAPLAAAPDVVLQGARAWFDAAPLQFTYDGGKLLASVFPDFSGGLNERLAALIAGGNEGDLAFVLGVLSAFEGRPQVYSLVRAIVTVLDGPKELLAIARDVLQASGVVRGEFGFAEMHEGRKTLLEPWLTDSNENVRIFAAEQIRELNRLIAAENRSAETSIALRMLEYGEELDVGQPAPPVP